MWVLIRRHQLHLAVKGGMFLKPFVSCLTSLWSPCPAVTAVAAAEPWRSSHVHPGLLWQGGGGRKVPAAPFVALGVEESWHLWGFLTSAGPTWWKNTCNFLSFRRTMLRWFYMAPPNIWLYGFTPHCAASLNTHLYLLPSLMLHSPNSSYLSPGTTFRNKPPCLRLCFDGVEGRGEWGTKPWQPWGGSDLNGNPGSPQQWLGQGN